MICSKKGQRLLSLLCVICDASRRIHPAKAWIILLHVVGHNRQLRGSQLEWLSSFLFSLMFLFVSLPPSPFLSSLSIHLSAWILIKVKPSFISIARQQVCCQMTFPKLNMTWQPRLYNNRLHERQGDKAGNYWDRVCSQTCCCFLFY